MASKYEKMSDTEYNRWRDSLSGSQWDRIGERTFTVVEYEVRTIDTDGDVIDMRAGCDTLAEAMEHFDRERIEDDVAGVVVEKATKTYLIRDRDSGVQDCDYQTVASKGDVGSFAR